MLGPAHRLVFLGGLLVLKIFDAEEMIYGSGFTQRSGTAEVETQCLYYAEINIIADSVELREGKT